MFRYGDWDCGFEQYIDKPQFGIFNEYYDGNIFALHIWRLWVTCFY